MTGQPPSLVSFENFLDKHSFASSTPLIKLLNGIGPKIIPYYWYSTCHIYLGRIQPINSLRQITQNTFLLISLSTQPNHNISIWMQKYWGRQHQKPCRHQGKWHLLLSAHPPVSLLHHNLQVTRLVRHHLALVNTCWQFPMISSCA